MGALTAYGSVFPTEIGSIFPGGLPARDDMPWQPPGSRQPINTALRQVRSATKPPKSWLTLNAKVQQLKTWYHNVIPEVLTLEEGLSRVKSLQDLRDIREDLLRQGENLKDYNKLSFSALLTTEADLSDICAYLYDSSFNVTEAQNLSALLDYLIYASSDRVSAQDFVDIACQLINSRMTLPAEVLNIVQHVSLLPFDRTKLPAAYRDLWRSVRAIYEDSVVLPVAQTILERLDIETKAISDALEGENWAAEHQDCFQLRLSLYKRLWPGQFKAKYPGMTLYILFWLRHRYEPFPQDASSIGLVQITRLLRHMNYQLLAETCNDVTAWICESRDSDSMLPRWLACVREACAAVVSSATIDEGTSFEDSRDVAFVRLMQQQYSIVGTRYCFPSLFEHLTNSSFNDAEICRLIALNWRGRTDPRRSQDASMQQWTCLAPPISQSSGTAFRRVLNKASQSMIKFVDDNPSENRAVAIYIRLLEAMLKTHYTSSAGLADLVIRIVDARRGTGAAIAVYSAASGMGYAISPSILHDLALRSFQTGPRAIEQLLSQRNLSGRSTSKLLKMLLEQHDLHPRVFWRFYSKKMQDDVRSYISHTAAEKWSNSSALSNRSALGQVHTIYQQLRTRKIPISPELSGALVKSGITRPLQQRQWVIDVRIRWILSIVAQVEGEDVAAKIDQLVYAWRMRNAQEERLKALEESVAASRKNSRMVAWEPRKIS